jgi:hypothetical protein
MYSVNCEICKVDLGQEPGDDLIVLKKRTLTDLYSQCSTCLELVYKKLDRAALVAYGWSDLMIDDGISEDEILIRLLALNLERAKAQPDVQPTLIEDDADTDDE